MGAVIDAATLAAVRAWVGSDVADPTDAVIAARFDVLGSVEAVALELLRARVADLLRDPARVAVDGDVSWDWSKNLEALDRQIGALEGLVAMAAGAGVGVLSVGRMQRSGCVR